MSTTIQIMYRIFFIIHNTGILYPSIRHLFLIVRVFSTGCNTTARFFNIKILLSAKISNKPTRIRLHGRSTRAVIWNTKYEIRIAPLKKHLESEMTALFPLIHVNISVSRRADNSLFLKSFFDPIFARIIDWLLFKAFTRLLEALMREMCYIGKKVILLDKKY